MTNGIKVGELASAGRLGLHGQGGQCLEVHMTGTWGGEQPLRDEEAQTATADLALLNRSATAVQLTTFHHAAM